MNVSELTTFMRSLAETCRYAAGRIRHLEKQAAEAEGRLRTASVADTLVRAGIAADADEAVQKIRKLAGMHPVEVARQALADPMGMFDPAPADRKPEEANVDNKLLTTAAFLEELRAGK
jgi:hypothetical protein